MVNATHRRSQRESSSARAKKKKKRLNRPIAAATAKKTLPVTPLRTSAVTSALASSTSARTRFDSCVVTSVTRPPIVCSPAGRADSGASGIDGSTGGTSAPLGLVGLATAVLLHEPV